MGNRAFLEIVSVAWKLEWNVPSQTPNTLYLLISCFLNLIFIFYRSQFDKMCFFWVYRIWFIIPMYLCIHLRILSHGRYYRVFSGPLLVFHRPLVIICFIYISLSLSLPYPNVPIPPTFPFG